MANNRTQEVQSPLSSDVLSAPGTASRTSASPNLVNRRNIDMSKTLRSTLTTLLKVAFALGLIIWMKQKGILDFEAVARLATPGRIAFFLGCVFAQIYLNNYRWMLLLRAQGIPATSRYTLPLSFIGMFFSFVMPGGVGGDVLKGYYLLQDYPKHKFAGAISIFMDRMIGFFIMIATAFVALFFNLNMVRESHELQSIAAAVSILFVGFMVFFALSFSRRLGRHVFETWFGHFLFVTLPGGRSLRRIYDSVHSYRNSPGSILLGMALSIVAQIPTVGFVYVIAVAMGVQTIPLEVYFLLVPVGIVVLALPISPAGIGVGQYAFYFLFSLYLGSKSQLGPTAVTIMQVTNFCWGLLGCYYYLSRKKPLQPTQS